MTSDPVQTPVPDAALPPSVTPDAGISSPFGPADAGAGPMPDAIASVDATRLLDRSARVATQIVQLTFYGWNDNTPPGNAIAYPAGGGYPTVHEGAEGVGTFADPITFASDIHELPAGTMVYSPALQKYLAMEDDCTPCDTEWTASRAWHVNVRMNSTGTDSASALPQCEGFWSRGATPIEIAPPGGRSVSTTTLFDPSSNA